MKLILMGILLTLSANAHSTACMSLKNDQKSVCNDYSNLKQKDPEKLKRFCSSGDINTAGLKIVNHIVEKCDSKDAVAKCRKDGHDVTFYYGKGLTFEEMKRGCKVFKNTEFIKL